MNVSITWFGKDLSKFGTTIRKCLTLPVRDWVLLAEAWCFVIWARSAAIRRSAWHLTHGPAVRTASGLAPARIAWAVRNASRLVPRSTCLVQALAARHLLARHGFAANVVIGVARQHETGFDAHAWVEYQGAVLIGQSGVSYSRLLDGRARA